MKMFDDPRVSAFVAGMGFLATTESLNQGKFALAFLMFLITVVNLFLASRESKS